MCNGKSNIHCAVSFNAYSSVRYKMCAFVIKILSSQIPVILLYVVWVEPMKNDYSNFYPRRRKHIYQLRKHLICWLCTYEIIPKLRQTNEERQGGAVLKEKKKKEGISIPLSILMWKITPLIWNLKILEKDGKRKKRRHATSDIPAGNRRSLDRLNYWNPWTK